MEFIRQLVRRGIPFLFVTNNSQRTKRDISIKLQRMGFPVEENHVFTCAIATNLDPSCPTSSGTRPGCGAIVAMLEAATGVKAFSVGKPSPVIMREARKELKLRTGEAMDTDILGGVQMGYRTVLVLSGGTAADQLETFAYQPDIVVDSLADLCGEAFFRAGIVAARSPARRCA